MTSIFDFDDALNAAYSAKTAGKNIVVAKHEVLAKVGDFLFLAHSDKEFALRCQMAEKDIENAAKTKMAGDNDSKFKLVRALHEEWKLRHANCKCAKDSDKDGVEEGSEAEHAGVVDNAIKAEQARAAGVKTADGDDVPGMQISVQQGPKTPVQMQPGGHAGTPGAPNYDVSKPGAGGFSSVTFDKPGKDSDAPINKSMLAPAKPIGPSIGKGSAPAAPAAPGKNLAPGSMFAPAGQGSRPDRLQGLPDESNSHDADARSHKDVPGIAGTGSVPNQNKNLAPRSMFAPAGQAPAKAPKAPAKPVGPSIGKGMLTTVGSRIDTLLERFDVRTAMAYNDAENTIPGVSADHTRSILASLSDRRLSDHPELEPKEGQWTIVHQRDPNGGIGRLTVARHLGQVKGGPADLADRACTGNSHEGYSNCQHGANEPHTQHYAVEQHRAVPKVDAATGQTMLLPHLYTKDGNGNVSNRGAGQAIPAQVPASDIYVMSDENHKLVRDLMNAHARATGSAVAHPETGEMVHPEHLPAGQEPGYGPDEQQGAFVSVHGGAHGKERGGETHVGQIIGFTTAKSDRDHAMSDFGVSRDRSPVASARHMLEEPPRDWSGNDTNNKQRGKIIAGPDGKPLEEAGSGRRLPIIRLADKYKKAGRNQSVATGGTRPDGSPLEPFTDSRLAIGSFDSPKLSEPGTLQVLEGPSGKVHSWKERVAKFAQLGNRGGTGNPGSGGSRTIMPSGGSIESMFEDLA